MSFHSFNTFLPEPIQFPDIRNPDTQIDVLRLDRIHPLVSGNKWFKLRYYVDQAKENNRSTLVSFGGAWSNHLFALAAYARENQFRSIGIIRGERPAIYSDTLQDLEALGMELFFISREEYKGKIVPAPLQEMINRGEAQLIPEGGYGIPGMEGAATIPGLLPEIPYTSIWCAVGTGTMIAGIIRAVGNHSKVIGIPVLKGHLSLEKDIRHLLGPNTAWDPHQLVPGYEWGGYAKAAPELFQFMNDWYKWTGIPSDRIYTGKLFYAFWKALSENSPQTKGKILLIHSGGLQGNRSLEKGLLFY